MKNGVDLTQEPDLGYHFYPYEVEDHPGHLRMDVILNAVPTYRHFDPLKAQYPVAALEGGIDRITVCHPWRQGSRYRACAGRVILSDRFGKTVEAFSFGGDLQIETMADRSICALVSTAPIFPLYSTMDLPMCLTAEVEILLACLKARANRDRPFAFEEHLAAADPFQLYTCCLQALLEKGYESHSGDRELDHHVEHFLRSERRRLLQDNRWPRADCTLEQLFFDESEDRSPARS